MLASIMKRLESLQKRYDEPNGAVTKAIINARIDELYRILDQKYYKNKTSDKLPAQRLINDLSKIYFHLNEAITHKLETLHLSTNLNLCQKLLKKLIRKLAD